MGALFSKDEPTSTSTATSDAAAPTDPAPELTTPAPPTRPVMEVKEMTAEEVALVEQCLGYQFEDRSLASAALTHPSFYPRCTKTSPTYDRLEFVGDAVLNLLVAREVFNAYPLLQSGPLSRLRAVNVDTEKFARIAVNHGLHRHVRHRAPCLEGQIKQFMESLADYPHHSNGLLDPPKVLADIVESLLGAIFLDSNSSLDAVWKVFMRLAEPLINEETLGKHPVTELLELCQKRRMQLKFLKDTWKENTMVKVLIDDNLAGSAAYPVKKEIALNRAAKNALDKLKVELAELEFTPFTTESEEHDSTPGSSTESEEHDPKPVSATESEEDDSKPFGSEEHASKPVSTTESEEDGEDSSSVESEEHDSKPAFPTESEDSKPVESEELESTPASIAD